MSDNQNESHNNTILKPNVNKPAIKLHRPQTEGYTKDESIDPNMPSTSKNMNTKLSLNKDATAYIPKSFTKETTTPNVNSSEKPAVNPSPQLQPVNNMMNTSNFNKGNYNTNMNTGINQMNANYNMPQSKIIYKIFFSAV